MLVIEEYNPNESDVWDTFVDNSVNGTVFHKQRFLNYHGNKFDSNINHLLFKKGERVFGIIPLGIFNHHDSKVAKSPFGASWGGFVHMDSISLKESIQMVNIFLDYLRQLNVDEVIITPPPQPYYKNYNCFIEFSLISAGFRIAGRDVLHVVDLQKKGSAWDLLDSKCRNQARKGNQLFDIVTNVSVDDFYSILEEDKQRLNAPITHTKEELKNLNLLFPEIYLDIAIDKQNKSKAGICYFGGNSNCVSTFYMVQETLAKGKNAMNALVLKGMVKAKEENLRYFDFGTSSINGVIENIGISEFKESFGAKGFFRDTYKMSLK